MDQLEERIELLKNLELHTIVCFEDLALVEKEWTKILDTKQNTNPFIEFMWIYEWWKHLGGCKNIEISVVKENGKIVAIFPFLYTKKGALYEYSFLGLGQANYMEIIAFNRKLEALIRFVIDSIIEKKKHVVFKLHGILESSDTFRALNKFLQKNNYPHTKHRVITPYINLKKIELEEYMKKRKKIHRLDRREKRIRENGNVDVLVTGPDKMEEIFDIHHKRWKKKHDTSRFTYKQEREFYKSLATRTTGDCKTEIDGLYLDGKMIAFNYGYRCRGRYISYVLGFDDDYDVFSPGRILEKEKILQCSERDITVFDLSIGYETYKFEWNTDVDHTTKMIFSSNTPLSRMYRRILSGKEGLISRVKLNQKIVLFKRNKLGKAVYIIKNIFRKGEAKEARKIIVEFLAMQFRKIFHMKSYYIYEIPRKDVKARDGIKSYTELTIKDSTSKYSIFQPFMRDICTKIYGGSKGFYDSEEVKYENVIWLNEKVFRIDEISYLKDFRKSSISIENWRIENIAEICSYIKKKSNVNKLFVFVKRREKKKIAELEKQGFILKEKIVKRTVFGVTKMMIT